MFCMASTRYYLYAKNKNKIQYGEEVMAPFKKTQKNRDWILRFSFGRGRTSTQST